MRILLSWSSGKDAAWTLHELRRAGEHEVVGLLTTVNEAFDRVAMHAVRRELLEAQADAAGIELWTVPLPWPCSNEVYEQRMAAACQRALDAGIEGVAFGDLFLEDVRDYRIRQLAPTGLKPLFPLFGRDTHELARQMVAGGLRARLTAVDPRRLDRSFVGRTFDAALLDDLPDGVDPCGENGEFHSFAFDGPMFAEPIRVALGDVVEREGFWFADLLLESG